MKSLGMRLFLANVGLWLGGGFGSAFVFLCRRRSLFLTSTEPPRFDLFTWFFNLVIPESFFLAVFVPLGMLIGALLGFGIPKRIGATPRLSTFAEYAYRQDETHR